MTWSFLNVLFFSFRARFELICSSLFSKCVEAIKKLLQQVGFTADDISKVIIEIMCPQEQYLWSLFSLKTEIISWYIYISSFDWNPAKSIDSRSLELQYLISFQVFEVKYKVESHSVVCFYCCILNRWGGSVSTWCLCVTLPKSKLSTTFLESSLWALFCLHWTLDRVCWHFWRKAKFWL